MCMDVFWLKNRKIDGMSTFVFHGVMIFYDNDFYVNNNQTLRNK